MDDRTGDNANSREETPPPEADSTQENIGTETGQETEERRQERIAHFIRHLTDDDEVTRWRSAEALGRIGDPVATGPLIDALWDEDSRVRLKAVWALGAIGDPRAIPSLRRLYRIEKEGMREIISEALEAIALQDRQG